MNPRVAELTSAVERNLSENIRRHMERRGVTQIVLARELGLVNRTSLYDRLAGRARWLLPEVLYLAELFEVSVLDLLNEPA